MICQGVVLVKLRAIQSTTDRVPSINCVAAQNRHQRARIALPLILEAIGLYAKNCYLQPCLSVVLFRLFY
ncbi:hypothetical protein BN2475_1050006 [Paraburkholderia ribeironis]|uniref:Uncharacterized protein n=1 Tax=Paraburkholderia ribeironis TaxID=1247936 RepID=A0A1N7SM67_9BURK|nr:hypothetical protein BN2475_1050006 [Paraburkholderia ribeironis]